MAGGPGSNPGQGTKIPQAMSKKKKLITPDPLRRMGTTFSLTLVLAPSSGWPLAIRRTKRYGASNADCHWRSPVVYEASIARWCLLFSLNRESKQEAQFWRAQLFLFLVFCCLPFTSILENHWSQKTIEVLLFRNDYESFYHCYTLKSLSSMLFEILGRVSLWFQDTLNSKIWTMSSKCHSS